MVALFGIFLGAGVVAKTGGAQMALPPLAPYTDADSAMGRITAAELQWRVMVRGLEVESVVGFRDTRYPIDSLLGVTAATARVWLGELERHPIKGMQLDPAGDVAVTAGDQTNAHAQFKARLATPGLPVSDRAYTYLTAVLAFTNYHFPERLPVAEQYISKLAALGSEADPWLCEADMAMADVYYELGRTKDLLRHGKRALVLAATMPQYVDRYRHGIAYELAGTYLKTAEGLAGLPNGRQQIDSLNAILRAGVAPPPGLSLIDSMHVRQQVERDRDGVEYIIAGGALLGTVGRAVTENYWVNRPTHDSATIPVDNGHVTLLETFPYTCNGCVFEMFSLERLRQQFPDITIMGATFTLGGWSNRMLDGPEEAEHVRAYFADQLKLTLPIGIWMGKKTVHADGSVTPFGPHGEILGPTASFYPSMAKATIWVLDGHGRIRRIYAGGGGRDMEAEMARTINFLEREAANQASGAQGAGSHAS